ncbi:MAG: endolytic transglycosylase MltG [Defluviitaleaceae bacterium]|nr:endolytic transglycosylase MltG [Defluviitaleaceae bacterium]
MKTEKAANFAMYLAGMAFNLALMALVGYLAITGFNRGYAFGGEFAGYMVAVGEDYEVEFYIPHDTPAMEIAQRLEDEEIIHNSLLFMLEIFLRGATNDFEAGTFTLNRNMNNVEINRALRARERAVAQSYTIRIPEGWTIRDMAEYFEYREFFPAEEFIHVAQYGHFSFTFLLDISTDHPNRLEGFLFPDTYQIPVNPRPGDIITRMLRNFELRFTDEFYDRAYDMNLTLHEVITMASIVESETRLASERPLVSQVIHRRIAQNMHLGMDSTVKYGMDDPPLRLLNVHTAVDSPWNTYTRRGLPIGPISNPGVAAIEAVLWPSETTYLYFVLRDPETGAHHFTHTYAEHNAAIARYAHLWRVD